MVQWCRWCRTAATRTIYSLPVLVLAQAMCIQASSSAACDVWVDSASRLSLGAACGTEAAACATIQAGIESATAGDTVCVTGHFGDCTEGRGYAAMITKSLTLKGLGVGATIDCGGIGSGFYIEPANASIPIAAVTLEGFHLRNTNGTLAGGVEASGVKAMSIMSTTFERCIGARAGAILFQGSGDGNQMSVSDVDVRDCHSTGSRQVAGGIGIVYNTSGHHIYNNINSFVSVTATDCSGGNGNGEEWSIGGGAGGIAVVYKTSNIDYSMKSIYNNTNSFQSVTATNCSGGNGNGDGFNQGRSGGGAGGIAVVYNSMWDIFGNTNSFVSVTATSCSGGGINGGAFFGAAGLGGGAGGIAVVYNTGLPGVSGTVGNAIYNNTNSFMSVTVIKCSGGDQNGGSIVGGSGGGAGGIAVVYNTDGDSIYNNINSFMSVTATNCIGGDINGGGGGGGGFTGGALGGGAGGIAVVYNSDSNQIYSNSNSFMRVTVTNCSGGNVNGGGGGGGGGAGGIAVVYNSDTLGGGEIFINDNSFISVTVTICTGGNGYGESGFGGGAGGIAVVYRGNAGSYIHNNTNSFMSVTTTHCGPMNGKALAYLVEFAGTNAKAVGTGGIALVILGYGSDNSAAFVETKISQCIGGDAAQGAGGLLVTSSGTQERNSIHLLDSTIESNTGGIAPAWGAGSGVAAGARVYLISKSSWVVVKGTNVSRNRLNCGSLTCIAGGFAVSGANTSITSSSFDANTSPSQAGALAISAPAHVSLDNTTFTNNTAVVFGTARLGSVSATNSTMFQFPDTSLALQASFEEGSQYTIRCHDGMEVEQESAKYQCMSCSEGTYNLLQGTWVDGEEAVGCKPCPSQDTTKVICSGGTSVTSQPGFFLSDISTTIQVSRCPNPAACIGANLTSSNQSQCAEGYTGQLCVQCEDGWSFPQMEPLVCKTCLNSGLAIFVALLFALGVYGTLAYSCATATTTSITSRYQLSALLKMILVHCTVLQAIKDTPWAWASSLRHAIHITGTAAGPTSYLDLHCVFGWNFREQFIFFLTAPAIGALLVSSCCYLGCLCDLSPFGDLKSTIGTMAILGFYAFLPQVMANLVTAFPCYHGADGALMMAYSPETECGHYEFLNATAVFSIVGLVFGAVWLIAIGLYTNREAIQASMKRGQVSRDSLEMLRQYGFLFKGYKQQYYLWEVWQLSRKCLVLMIAATTPPSIDFSTRTTILVILLSSSFGLQIHCRPHADSSLDLQKMDVVSQFCSLMSVILAGYVSSLQNNPVHTSKHEVATVLFVVLNTLLFGIFGSRGIKPMLSTVQQLYHRLLNPAGTPAINDLGDWLEALSGPLLEEGASEDGASEDDAETEEDSEIEEDAEIEETKAIGVQDLSLSSHAHVPRKHSDGRELWTVHYTSQLLENQTSTLHRIVHAARKKNEFRPSPFRAHTTQLDAGQGIRSDLYCLQLLGITGTLIYKNSSEVSQVLEGPREDVLALCEKITADERHTVTKVTRSESITRRLHNTWMDLEIHTSEDY